MNPSKKSEIKPIVVPAGPSVPPKPSVTDGALPTTNNLKTESPLKTFFHAVDSLVVWDATVDFYPELGASLKELVPLPEIFMEMKTLADLIVWLLVIIMLKDNMSHVLEIVRHQNVLSSVRVVMLLIIRLISIRLRKLMVLEELKRFSRN